MQDFCQFLDFCRDKVKTRFDNGTVVAAKLGVHPYWPAMIDTDPNTSEFFWVEGQTVENPTSATHYNVVFFGKPVTRNWVHTSRITEYEKHFPEELTDTELQRMNKLPKKAKERKLIAARQMAEEALKMDLNERTKKFSFVHTYKGKITPYVPPSPESSSPSAVKPNKDDTVRQKRGTKPGKRQRLKPTDESLGHGQKPASLKLRITKDRTGGKSSYSSKTITVTKAASCALSAELSEFASTFPPSPQGELSEASTSAPVERKRRKKKGKSKGRQKKSKSDASPEIVVDDNDDDPVQEHGGSLHPAKNDTLLADEPIEPSIANQLKPKSANHPSPPVSPSPRALDQRQIGVAYPFQQVPPEETMEYQMSNVLQRAQANQELPPRLMTNKTVSNISLAVNEDTFIDLTAEDDEPLTVPWEVGELVLAHLNGLQPWPAVIDVDPSYENKFIIPSTGRPELIHVIFLELNKNNWVPVKNVVKFNENRLASSTNYSHKFNNALVKAQDAMKLSRADRIALFGSSNTFTPYF